MDTQCKDDEKPLHMVSISAFSIDKTEVTQAEYTSCVKAGQCSPPGCDWDCSMGDIPAGCVNLADAKAYCAYANGRLPTEAEWELAARGTDERIYPWGNDAPTCDLVNMDGCGEVAQSVGSHPSGASPYGALDMAGNVVELVADYYAADYYATSPTMDPKGPATGAHFVGRGGGYKSVAIWQRTSARDTYDTDDSAKSLGFRCAH
ncbi:MAG TPA: formylglycine-generating enzyme family protein [Polyangiaceae bacterium]|nr:formylglycine-generating enzyme family protein [Polyangiaceae bacterium]